MRIPDLIHTFKRYRSLRSHRLSVVPIAILMPHSSCNCRCIMCDIWKGNKNLKQLTKEDIVPLLKSLKKLDTKMIVMSGGEALLNKNFFTFCELIRKEGIKITLLTTGMTVEHHAARISELVDEVIVSLDGDATVHDMIRNIKGAYAALKSGTEALKKIRPNLKISARCVIHRYNFRNWERIVQSAREMGLDQISFLPADVTSEAFNREVKWEADKQEDVLVAKHELKELDEKIEDLIKMFDREFESGYIAESPDKIRLIGKYYNAHHGFGSFPAKKCNAPWVSVVIEADGTVRPCFFHDAIGNIREGKLEEILNSEKGIGYRRALDVSTNPTCQKCVCSLNLGVTRTLN